MGEGQRWMCSCRGPGPTPTAVPRRLAAALQAIVGSLESFDALAAELSGQLPGDHAR